MANAARHFPMRATQKAIDLSTFVIVAGSIEIPRIAMSMQLARQPAQPQRPMGQVFQFVKPANAPPPPATSPIAEGAGAASPPVADGPPDYSSGDGAIGGEPAA